MKKENHLAMDKILEIWVQPRASRNEILGYRGEFLRIRVTAPPTDGEANRLCRQLLAETLGVSVSRVEILKGHKTRRKRVRIKDAEGAHWQRLKKDRKSG